MTVLIYILVLIGSAIYVIDSSIRAERAMLFSRFSGLGSLHAALFIGFIIAWFTSIIAVTSAPEAAAALHRASAILSLVSMLGVGWYNTWRLFLRFIFSSSDGLLGRAKRLIRSWIYRIETRKTPDEKYPEIKRWRENDVFKDVNTRSGSGSWVLNRIYRNHMISVRSPAKTGTEVKLPIKEFLKSYKNESLREREEKEELEDSYYDSLKVYWAAVDESKEDMEEYAELIDAVDSTNRSAARKTKTI